MLPLAGYADRFSVAPGETIAFKVSSALAGTYQARLVRVISGDPNPAGPGIRERDVPAPFAGSYPSRVQRVPLGSYARVPDAPALQGLTSFRAEAIIWPTTPAKGRQGIIAKRDAATGAGFALWIDARGAGASIGDGRDAAEVEVGKPLRERAWYRVSMAYDAASGTLSVRQEPLDPAFGVDDAGAASARSSLRGAPVTGAALVIGAMGGEPVGGHFNGKIEAPALLDRPADEEAPRSRSAAARADVIAAWDFSRDVTSQRIVDAGPNVLHGELVNLPARGMKGARWTGEEMCWRHAPRALRGHPFPRRRPARLRLADRFHVHGARRPAERRLRGAPGVRGRRGDDPVLRAPAARPARAPGPASSSRPSPTMSTPTSRAGSTTDAYRARVAAWGARPWTIRTTTATTGCRPTTSTRDGSGIAYSSRLRPIMTMRPGFLAYVDARGSGLRHLPGRHASGRLARRAWAIEFDVVTDEDLHAEGAGAAGPVQGRAHAAPSGIPHRARRSMRCRVCGAAAGGSCISAATASTGASPCIRTCPAPSRCAAPRAASAPGRREPGEYYHAFDGGYGGLWRRNGRPPAAARRRRLHGHRPRSRATATAARPAPPIRAPRLDPRGRARTSSSATSGSRAAAPRASSSTAPTIGWARRRTPSWSLAPRATISTASRWCPRSCSPTSRRGTGEPRDKLIRADMIYFESAGRRRGLLGGLDHLLRQPARTTASTTTSRASPTTSSAASATPRLGSPLAWRGLFVNGLDGDRAGDAAGAGDGVR